MSDMHDDLRHDPIPTCDCHACALHERNRLRTQIGDMADGDAVRDAAWHYDREERDALKAENERLKEFVAHPRNCMKWSANGNLIHENRCTCGLQALLDGRGDGGEG